MTTPTLPQLTPDETATARNLWRDLMTGNAAARDALDAAPEPIRAALMAASKRALESGDEPDASANPFEETRRFGALVRPPAL